MFATARRGPVSVQPVRASVGRPRFWPAANRFPVARLITPYGLLKLNGKEFEKHYLARLNEAGVDAIRAELEAIYQVHRHPLTLACFELDRANCHRGQFAEWWEKQTGVVVPEWTGDPLTRAEELQFDSTTDEKGGAA
jgi:hypothetical protein